ncbi:hypothetical protein [Pseudovibrio ascidiaceicola]|uniref:hypothetical protein n=1 Tax=Pseudovibrio ascidiaceicola TaxID=285279 RepID=UPI001AD8C5CA|nr:hypothetical protein [Pseudovibrio ascidiaceicola]
METLLLLRLFFGLTFLRMSVMFAMLAASVIFILVKQITGASPLFSAFGLKTISQRVTLSLESFPLLRSRCSS